MSDFEIWFEINKVTSNRSPDMEGLKDLFEKCWNDSQNKCLENTSDCYEPDDDDISNLENYVSELENDVDNLQSIVRKLSKR